MLCGNKNLFLVAKKMVSDDQWQKEALKKQVDNRYKARLRIHEYIDLRGIHMINRILGEK